MLLGHIDLVDRHGVRGWAADTDRPHGTLEVAIFVNEQLVGRTRADQMRYDPADAAILGAGEHGVAFAFEPPLTAERDHNVAVRFAEGGILLGQWRLAREAAAGMMTEAPAKTTGGAASEARPAELPAPKLPAPPLLAPGLSAREAPVPEAPVPEAPAPEALTSKALAPEALAPKWPSRLSHLGSGALPDDSLVGFVDSCTQDHVDGWAASETNPDEVLDVSIFVDDRKVAQVRCDQPRDDLAKAGIAGHGARGFSHAFDPPLPMDRPTRVTVTYARTGSPLTSGTICFTDGKSQGLDPPRPLAEDEPRLLAAPSGPRALFELLGLYDDAGGLAQWLSRIAFNGTSPEQVHYSVFGDYPASTGKALRWTPYYARDHLHRLLLCDDFQTQLIPLLLRAFPEKRRLIFVHIPKCAGTDLIFHLRARFPSIGRSLTDPGWTEKAAMLRRVARVVSHVHTSDCVFVHGHINLADHIAAGVIRPSDHAFTIIREPLSAAISQINYVLTRFDEDMAAGEFRPDTKEWADVLDLGTLPPRMSDAFIKRLTGAALRHEDLVLPNSIGSWLGGEGAQPVMDRLARFNVEVTDTSRYNAWLAQAWGIDARTRWNASKTFVTTDSLATDDLIHLNSITSEDRRIYRAYQAIVAASGRLSVTGDALRGVVVR